MKIYCNTCNHATENAHYGECGDLYTGYCQLKDEPIDLKDGACEEYTDDFSDVEEFVKKDDVIRICNMGIELASSKFTHVAIETIKQQVELLPNNRTVSETSMGTYMDEKNY